MSLILSGSDGVSDIDGSASTPAIRGTDTNTGIFFPSADTIAFAEGGAEVARFNSSGNLGLGTTNPTTKLTVFAGDDSSSDLNALLLINNGENGTNINFNNAFGALAQIKGTKLGGGSDANEGVLAFSTAFNSSLSERMRIDSSGFLLVNTTAVRNSGRISVDFNGATAGGMGINDANSVNAGVYIGFLSGGTFRGNITNNNNTSVSYNTTSDYRLKDNIAPMTGALAKVQALKPVTYTWKESGIESQGFIAHELAEVCPDAVTGEKDAVDAEGNPQYQGIDTSFLVATLTAAIQEQQAIITDLKSRIETLEAK